MKVKNSIKKIGAVAGSAMMVGLTMGSAASLAEFPQPFVEDDGTVASQIVVGSSGKVADVVGAVNLAASMGQAAVQTETQTATAAGGSYGFSASDGAALSTQNTDLYFGSNINDVRSTLTSEHLDALADTTFQDDAGTQTDIEHYLYVGQQPVEFGDAAEDEDPSLHVTNPTGVESLSGSVSESDYLYRLQANFENSVEFSDSDEVLDDVEGQEITLFGKTYVVSADTDDDNLVLLGSQDEISLEDGETGTITVGGSDHDIEVVAITDSSSGTAAFRVDGQLRQKNEGQSFNLNGEQVRLDTVIQTNSQTSSGLVTFAVGSEQITLNSGNAVQDENDDDIDGTYVEFNGADGDNSGELATGTGLSSINVYVGTNDDDMDYVEAGESWSHPLFENVVFHFGGLNPNAAEGGNSIGEVEFSTSGDDTATASFTSSTGDSTTVEWLHEGAADLQDSDDQGMVVVEGADVTEDEYFFSDAGDFAHMWQVTNVDRDGSDGATVDLRDVVTGQNVEVDLDEDAAEGANGVYEGPEVIDGQTYSFELEHEDDESDDEAAAINVAWGAGDHGVDTGSDDTFSTGTHTTVYPALDLDSGAAFALTDAVSAELDGTVPNDGDSDVSLGNIVLPSTESTGTLSVEITGSDTADGSAPDGAGSNDNNADSFKVDGDTIGSGVIQVVGQTAYHFSVTDGDTATPEINVALADDQSYTDGQTSSIGSVSDAAALVIEPEDENDEEHAYIQTATYSGSPSEMSVGDVTYTGDDRGEADLESNDDVRAAYDFYGIYSEYDSDDQGSVSLHVPNGQAVVGAAFSNNGGELTAGGSAGSVTYEAVTGMGALPNMARLDSEVTESVRSNNHLILVGGPAVNTLVSDLVDSGDVDMSELADQGSGAMLQVVEDAFTSGKHALVVAGYGAADTRAASRYLANYDAHSDALADAGIFMVLTEADYPSEN